MALNGTATPLLAMHSLIARQTSQSHLIGYERQGCSRAVDVVLCDAYREGRDQRGLGDAVATESHKQRRHPPNPQRVSSVPGVCLPVGIKHFSPLSAA